MQFYDLHGATNNVFLSVKCQERPCPYLRSVNFKMCTELNVQILHVTKNTRFSVLLVSLSAYLFENNLHILLS